MGSGIRAMVAYALTGNRVRVQYSISSIAEDISLKFNLSHGGLSLTWTSCVRVELLASITLEHSDGAPRSEW